MSTEHNGAFCPIKNKMVLSSEEARKIAARLHHEAYQCKECGGWHVASRKGRAPGRNKWQERKERKYPKKFRR